MKTLIAFFLTTQFLWAQDSLVRCVVRPRVHQKQAATKRLPAGIAAKLIRIPVVVHVVHSNATGSIGGADNGNISDDQIKSQIEVLNEDFRKKSNSLGFNTYPFGADSEIEFFLALRDPNGQPTKGITRAYSATKTWNVDSNADLLSVSRLNYWPSDQFLNIWVTTLKGGVLGYSGLPYVPDLELSNREPAALDGVFIDHRNFGKKIGTATLKGDRPLYAYGRTLTHEVGHWLGLYHTWGDEFCGDDFVSDTPPCANANQSKFCTDKFSNCTGVRTRNLIENYMDYSPDSCMNVFTEGQKLRMQMVMELDPQRKSVALNGESQSLRNVESEELVILPNPVDKSVYYQALMPGISTATIRIFNAVGDLVLEKNYTERSSFVDDIDVSLYTSGLYFLQFTTQNKVISKRFLKQ